MVMPHQGGVPPKDGSKGRKSRQKKRPRSSCEERDPIIPPKQVPIKRSAPAPSCRHRKRRRLLRRNRSLPSRCLRRAGSGHSPTRAIDCRRPWRRRRHVGDLGLVVHHEQLAEERVFLAELRDRAIDHLGDDVGGLARNGSLFGRDRALTIEDRAPRRGPPRAAPAGKRRRCASRAACRAARASSTGSRASSATSTPILPRPAAAALWT
jgi:hypothetical protein